MGHMSIGSSRRGVVAYNRLEDTNITPASAALDGFDGVLRSHAALWEGVAYEIEACGGQPKKLRSSVNFSSIRWRAKGRVKSSLRSLLYQALRWNTKAAVEFTDHSYGQRALTVKHLINAVTFADHWLQVFGLKALLLHAEIDRLDGVRQRHWKVLGLKGLNQGHEHI